MHVQHAWLDLRQALSRPTLSIIPQTKESADMPRLYMFPWSVMPFRLQKLCASDFRSIVPAARSRLRQTGLSALLPHSNSTSVRGLRKHGGGAENRRGSLKGTSGMICRVLKLRQSGRTHTIHDERSPTTSSRKAAGLTLRQVPGCIVQWSPPFVLVALCVDFLIGSCHSVSIARILQEGSVALPGPS